MTIKEHQGRTSPGPQADALALAALGNPRRFTPGRSRRLPQISALAAAFGVGVAGVSATAALDACSSSTSPHPQASVTSKASHHGATGHKTQGHAASPGPRELKPPTAHPATGYGTTHHATSSPSAHSQGPAPQVGRP